MQRSRRLGRSAVLRTVLAALHRNGGNCRKRRIVRHWAERRALERARELVASFTAWQTWTDPPFPDVSAVSVQMRLGQDADSGPFGATRTFPADSRRAFFLIEERPAAANKRVAGRAGSLRLFELQAALRDDAGKSAAIVVPRPSVLSARTRPPCASTKCLTIANPSPVPPASRDRDESAR
jgi:hypothetical protein